MLYNIISSGTLIISGFIAGVLITLFFISLIQEVKINE